MPKKKKIPKIMNPVTMSPSSNKHKMCPIIWDRNEYGMCILTMENAHVQYNRNPMFYVPLRTFMQCGAFWSALNLCTVFWEPPLYGIPRAHVENERIKGAHLIAFASDLAPVCKEWARSCIEQCNQNQKASDEVFVEIVLFNEARKAQMMDAISRHELNVSICEATNTHTVI
jgi:hypothetical protein